MPTEGVPSGQWLNQKAAQGGYPLTHRHSRDDVAQGNGLGSRSRLIARRQPPLSAGLTSNSRCRIKDAGLRNREEKHVRPERCGPLLNADEALFN